MGLCQLLGIWAGKTVGNIMEGVQSQSSLQSRHDIVVMFSQRLHLVIIQCVLVVVLLLERDM